MTPSIDWARVVQAANFYQTVGYKQVDLPWTVDRKFSMATCPDPAFLVESSLGDLVGSAEQSFIQQDYLGLLGKGKFQAITPCFRRETTLDDLHQPSFLKLELYVNEGDLFAAMREMARGAQTVAMEVVRERAIATEIMLPAPVLEEIDGGLDLTIGGIELGSYGVRSFEHVAWAFGTGLAEPRLSSAIKLLENQANEKRKAYFSKM